MSQREAFERYLAECDLFAIVPDAAGAFNWAIQHALDVAVKACKTRIMGDHNREDQEAQRCADAIKEALK